MRIDLHVHTTISDSSLSTKEMLLLAKERGLTHVAITNHELRLVHMILSVRKKLIF